ncbi:hypothetical protein [Trinickia dinghuensis]|uniref:Uncharacterized protein n=1 Tax=Trinickia dinghuensis TaxID=2291023 RepID=A0A3D8JUT4_9BURK|nr:hypothetical protein [Trinickia dinghuensis]RDU96837.1 hypothetical protein DWV00_21460 [Trinickia dinghuensis]
MTPGKRRLLVLFLIVLIGISPFISVSIAGAIADGRSCGLDEGSIHPCMFLGHDVGNLLYTMFVMGWAGLVTIPTALGLLGVWGVVELVLAGRRKARS